MNYSPPFWCHIKDVSTSNMKMLVTLQNVMLTQNVIRIATKCNNIDAKCNKMFNAKCNNLSTQIVITFLTHNVITQNVTLSE